jgi:thymidylate synthase
MKLLGQSEIFKITPTPQGKKAFKIESINPHGFRIAPSVKAWRVNRELSKITTGPIPKYATVRLNFSSEVIFHKDASFIPTYADLTYRELATTTVDIGGSRADRTGVGTIGIFGHMSQYRDVGENFPLLTSKFVSLKAIAAELKWFLRGDSNNHNLNAMGCTIWDEWDVDELFPDDLIAKFPSEWKEWVKENGGREAEVDDFRCHLKDQGIKTTSGDLGPIYGKQWRSWPTKDGKEIDQIKQLLVNLIEKPYSRRHVVSGWNPEYLPDEFSSHEVNILNGKQVLPPCHLMFQFNVEPPSAEDYCAEKTLNCLLYQRSGDIALGVPYNIASYSLMLLLFARFCGYKPGKLVHVLGDAHVYKNHLETLEKQLNGQLSVLDFSRISKDSITDYLPIQVEIDPAIKTLDDFLNWPDDKPWYTLKNYRYAGKFKYDVAV